MGSWLLLLALTAGCKRAVLPERTAPDTPCHLPPAERLWVQEALDLWARVTADYLQIPHPALPWSVYFDQRCAYHVASERPAPGALPLMEALTFQGAPLPTWGVEHSGQIALPNGSEIPAGPHAAASLYDAPSPTPFFAMSLVEIWASIPGAAHVPDLSDQMLTIAQHEMTHTLQLRAIGRLAESLAEEGHALPSIDDDAIQRAFQGDPTYSEAYAEEVRQLRAAVAAVDPSEKKRLARGALGLARERHARYFTGLNAVFAALDGRFLSMEGLGEWVRVQLILDAAELGERPELDAVDPHFDGYHEFRKMDLAAAMASLDGGAPYWSQQEGLAIVLLLEELLPGFPERLLGPELPDAFVLLEEATDEG